MLHPKLSYEVIGSAFSVYNELGGGLPEKVYGNALELEFQKKSISYQREFSIDLTYSNEKIGNAYADYLIENKLILELKVGQQFNPAHFKQTTKYIQSLELDLGILVLFTSHEVKFRRVVNFQTNQLASEPIQEYSVKNTSDLKTIMNELFEDL